MVLSPDYLVTSIWVYQLPIQPSLYILHHCQFTVYFLIYVDDIIITSSNTSVIDELLGLLRAEFAIKDLGGLNFFLGIEVVPTSSGVLLTQ
jgi:hypothetical protein